MLAIVSVSRRRVGKAGREGDADEEQRTSGLTSANSMMNFWVRPEATGLAASGDNGVAADVVVGRERPRPVRASVRRREEPSIVPRKRWQGRDGLASC